MKKTKIAMLGAGLMAPSHMEAIRKLGEQAELVAVADIYADACRAAADKNGIPRQYNYGFWAFNQSEERAGLILHPAPRPAARTPTPLEGRPEHPGAQPISDALA